MTPLVKRQPPKGLLRLFLRLPLCLYRLHLGCLLGSRFLMLTHRGRVSGLPRQTVVEVIHHDTATDTYFVASGWGEKAQWLRNLQHNPAATIQVGRRRCSTTAKRLSLDEAQHVLLLYAQHYPTAFGKLSQVIAGRRLQGTPEGCRTLAQSVPVIALRNHDTSHHQRP